MVKIPAQYKYTTTITAKGLPSCPNEEWALVKKQLEVLKEEWEEDGVKISFGNLRYVGQRQYKVDLWLSVDWEDVKIGGMPSA